MRKLPISCAAVIGVLGVLVRPCASVAELVALDLAQQGDHLITRDTATNLDWLDLTATQNLSPASILNGAGGWLAMGFRYAVTSEVSQLFLNSDPNAFINNEGPNPLYDVTPVNLAGAQKLLSLMGTTFVQQPGNNYNIGGNGFADVDQPQVGFIWGADYGTNISRTAGFFFVRDGQFALSYSHPWMGSFLVRPVPEPTSGAAICLGASIFLLRRNKSRGIASVTSQRTSAGSKSSRLFGSFPTAG